MESLSSLSSYQFQCDTCNKTFSSKYTLKTHLERNKKCITSRGGEIKSDFVCKSCNHISMKRGDFHAHLSNCVKYIIDSDRKIYQEKIEEYYVLLREKQEYITMLEDKLKKYEKKYDIEDIKDIKDIKDIEKIKYIEKIEKIENHSDHIPGEMNTGKRFGLPDGLRYRDL